MWQQYTCEICSNNESSEYMQIREYNQYYNISDDMLFRLMNCTACDHYWIADRLSREELNDIYNAGMYRAFNSYFSAEKEARWRASACAFVDSIVDRVKPNGKLLEIGASFGYLINEAKRRGFDVKGIEPSAKASMYARQHLGLDVTNTTIENFKINESDRFDVIVLISVLEHVYDLKATMIGISKMLKPGGMLFIEVPTINSISFKLKGKRYIEKLIKNKTGIFHPVEHVRYFTQRSLFTFLSQHFCQVEQICDPRIDTIYNLNPLRKFLSRSLRASQTGNIVFTARGRCTI